MDSSRVDIYSFANEKEIARSFSKRFQWEMVLIGLGQALVFFLLWPLVILEFIPLSIGAPIATLCALMAYLPSHEAQHGNYSRGNPKLKWLDGFVGHISLITLKFPYHILRITHIGMDSQKTNAYSMKIFHGFAGYEFQSITSITDTDVVLSYDADWGNAKSHAPHK